MTEDAATALRRMATALSEAEEQADRLVDELEGIALASLLSDRAKITRLYARAEARALVAGVGL